MAVVQANSGTGSFKQGILLIVEKFMKMMRK
jgi:hypothetical protein